MEKTLKNIEDLEKRFAEVEPQIEAFVPEKNRFQRLKEEALALFERYPNENQRPPLFGFLVGVKDIFHVNGFETRAGSKLPPSVLTGPEAKSVQQLIGSGALIVGKTVTTEFAYFGPGPTKNPNNHAHTPGGSSSGSAAAVAANLCKISLGTQTIGSVNRPAAFCGVTGYKPSYDRTSKAGVIPLAGSLDHVGVFGRSVADVEAVAQVLNRGWQPSKSQDPPILGIPEGPYLDSCEPEGQKYFEEVIDNLLGLGIKAIRIEVMPDFDDIQSRHQIILAAEAAKIHEGWFEIYHDKYHPKTRALILRGQSISEDQYQNAVSKISGFRQEILEQMQKEKIDAWITPSAPGPAPRGLESTGDPVMNLPWTQARLPTLTIPTSINEDNLPLGIQLVGRWFMDEKLFNCGKQLETLVAIHKGSSI